MMAMNIIGGVFAIIICVCLMALFTIDLIETYQHEKARNR